MEIFRGFRLYCYQDCGIRKHKRIYGQVFKKLLQESGINYSFESVHLTEGSIIVNVQFVGPLNFTNRIRHDISLKEKMVLEPERRPVRMNYSDLPEFEVLVYSLSEILAERSGVLCKGDTHVITMMFGDC